MIVVDASAIVDSLLRTPNASAVERFLFAPNETLHAPHLLDIEVTQVLRRQWLARNVELGRAREAIFDLATFPLRRHAHDLLLERIWELRNNFSAYDAAYVALAEALDAPLLTTDGALAAAARQHARVKLV